MTPGERRAKSFQARVKAENQSLRQLSQFIPGREPDRFAPRLTPNEATSTEPPRSPRHRARTSSHRPAPSQEQTRKRPALVATVRSLTHDSRYRFA
jgi:hypothetical protein